MILVTGAAGKTGRALVRALAAGRQPVRALIYRHAHAPGLQALGAMETPVADLRDQAAVQRAVDGVREVYHIAPNVSPDEIAIGRNVIAAAQSAGVERLVYHSVLHPHIEAMPHHWQKARVEELLFASGLAFTILQPTAYMQNIAAAWEAITARGRYPVPYSPEARLSLVDLEDVAQAAAGVLAEPGYAGATIEAVGTPGITPRQIAAALSAELGRPVEVERVPLETWKEGARAAGLGDYAISALAMMFIYYNDHGLTGSPRALASVLGRQPTSLQAFIRRTIQEHRA
ncbi:MAG: NAD-dependent epimerase/dehydratase family protein [Chloroflexi bacterium]|nr:NAD-dependent epimerase/dehydratase family protein [Chloroflexota bacterium]